MPEIELGRFAFVGFLECRATRILHVYLYLSLETPIGITLHTGCTVFRSLKYSHHTYHVTRMLCSLRCIMYHRLIHIINDPFVISHSTMSEAATKLLRVPAYSQIDTMCQWWELRRLRIAGKSSFSSQCQGSIGTITPAVLAPIIAGIAIPFHVPIQAVSGYLGDQFPRNRASVRRELCPQGSSGSPLV